MLRRLLVPVMLVAALGVVVAPAAAQSVQFNLGGFVPRAEDSRVTGDVLFENLNYLYFDINKFKGFTVGGDVLFPIDRRFEVGAGIGYYSKSVPSVDRDYVNADGSEIEQSLKLRIMPLNVSVRFLPLGNRGGFQPYIGAGLGVFVWRYSETGQFIDFNTYDIYRANYVANGSAVGPMIIGGIRMPISRSFAIGGEIRWQKADADVGTDFYGTRIDLGGTTAQATFTFRY